MKTEIIQPEVKQKKIPATKLDRFITILFVIGICVLCWALLDGEWNYAIVCGIILFLISLRLPSDHDGGPQGPVIH